MEKKIVAFSEMAQYQASTLGSPARAPRGPLSSPAETRTLFAGTTGRDPFDPAPAADLSDCPFPAAETPPTPTAPVASAPSTPAAATSPEAPKGKSNWDKGASADRQAKWAAERAETQALATKVDSIQTTLVMQALGGIGNQDRIRNKYKIPGVGNFSVDGQRWYHFMIEKGGNGPINLVKHVLDIKYHEAVRWLANEFGERVDADDIKASSDSLAVKVKGAFEPPMRVEKYLPFVKHYLHYSRAIPLPLIEQLILERRIYADEKKNCVFFSKGIAELRSSSDGPDAFKGLAEGSTRNYGFLVKADPAFDEKKISICESAIDAMSHRVLNPGRSAVSAAGANREFPRKVAEDAILNGYGVVAAFDADDAGDKASQALFNHFFVKLWVKHRLVAEKNVKLDNDELFRLLDEGVVDFSIIFPENDPKNNANVTFFNKADPFEDPSKPPVIFVTVRENPHGIPLCNDFELKVSKPAYDYIVDTMGIVRDRPTIGKDWNETVKQRRVELDVRDEAAAQAAQAAQTQPRSASPGP